jgi:hypothetical protein
LIKQNGLYISCPTILKFPKLDFFFIFCIGNHFSLSLHFLNLLYSNKLYLFLKNYQNVFDLKLLNFLFLVFLEDRTLKSVYCGNLSGVYKGESIPCLHQLLVTMTFPDFLVLLLHSSQLRRSELYMLYFITYSHMYVHTCICT